MEEWLSIEDLLKEAQTIHKSAFKYRGKELIVPWQELTLGEAPSFASLLGGLDPEKLTKEEMMQIGEKIGEETARAMIVKGQTAIGITPWTVEQWGKLPLTLRREIVAELTGSRNAVTDRF